MSLQDDIAVVNQRLMETFGAGDTERMASLYDEDGELLPPNSDVVRGRAAIAEFWSGARSMGLDSLTIETVDLEGDDTIAIEVGRYALSADGQPADAGKYIVIWKNLDGWKLRRDMWNTSLPAE